MFGVVLAWLKKQIGQRTDTASASGGLHAKIGDLGQRVDARYEASDTLQLSSLTTATGSGNTETIVKRAYLARSGTVKVEFSLRGDWSSATGDVAGYANILINGTRIRQRWRAIGTTPVACSAVVGGPGGEIAIACWSDRPDMDARVSNFKVFYDEVFSAPESLVLQD